MAKVIAPFKIVGTLEDLNFYIDENDINRVRMKGKTGVSSKEFRSNPVFQKIRNQGTEFGHCAKVGVQFRMLANQFNLRAKDGSFAGRANKLLFEILQEDTGNEQGKRTVANGIDTPEGKLQFVGFEGNKLRPLSNVLKTKWIWENQEGIFKIPKFNPLKLLDWPELANQVHLAVARTNWNYKENTFNTTYSEEITYPKEAIKIDIDLKLEIPEGNNLQMVYLFIGFSIKDKKRTIPLKRKYNTVTLIVVIP
ncbi:hypothetical protein [Flavobacterium psychrotolerans]|uniref:Uncharacterized protein n=1 Tax=Flavobacterium psychrotolerans TaxID=2169410 RepID=A0A2U1JFV9_9FLAO|nr:hypothetical protein [Flavobacterium psychrotolerans]PWA04026.1 hypothetical protein DB895_13035 [Flavobacterium psychrotolerans]